MKRHHTPKHLLALPRGAYAKPLPVRTSYHAPEELSARALQDKVKPLHQGAGAPLRAAQPSVFNGELIATTRAPDKTGHSSYRPPAKRAGMRAGRCTVSTYYTGVLTYTNVRTKR